MAYPFPTGFKPWLDKLGQKLLVKLDAQGKIASVTVCDKCPCAPKGDCYIRVTFTLPFFASFSDQLIHTRPHDTSVAKTCYIHYPVTITFLQEPKDTELVVDNEYCNMPIATINPTWSTDTQGRKVLKLDIYTLTMPLWNPAYNRRSCARFLYAAGTSKSAAIASVVCGTPDVFADYDDAFHEEFELQEIEVQGGSIYNTKHGTLVGSSGDDYWLANPTETSGQELNYTMSSSPSPGDPLYVLHERENNDGTCWESSYVSFVTHTGSNYQLCDFGSGVHDVLWAPGQWIRSDTSGLMHVRFPQGDIILSDHSFYAWLNFGAGWVFRGDTASYRIAGYRTGYDVPPEGAIHIDDIQDWGIYKLVCNLAYDPPVTIGLNYINWLDAEDSQHTAKVEDCSNDCIVYWLFDGIHATTIPGLIAKGNLAEDFTSPHDLVTCKYTATIHTTGKPAHVYAIKNENNGSHCMVPVTVDWKTVEVPNVGAETSHWDTAVYLYAGCNPALTPVDLDEHLDEVPDLSFRAVGLAMTFHHASDSALWKETSTSTGIDLNNDLGTTALPTENAAEQAAAYSHVINTHWSKQTGTVLSKPSIRVDSTTYALAVTTLVTPPTSGTDPKEEEKPEAAILYTLEEEPEELDNVYFWTEDCTYASGGGFDPISKLEYYNATGGPASWTFSETGEDHVGWAPGMWIYVHGYGVYLRYPYADRVSVYKETPSSQEQSHYFYAWVNFRHGVTMQTPGRATQVVCVHAEEQPVTKTGWTPYPNASFFPDAYKNYWYTYSYYDADDNELVIEAASEMDELHTRMMLNTEASSASHCDPLPEPEPPEPVPTPPKPSPVPWPEPPDDPTPDPEPDPDWPDLPTPIVPPVQPHTPKPPPPPPPTPHYYAVIPLTGNVETMYSGNFDNLGYSSDTGQMEVCFPIQVNVSGSVPLSGAAIVTNPTAPCTLKARVEYVSASTSSCTLRVYVKFRDFVHTRGIGGSGDSQLAVKLEFDAEPSPSNISLTMGTPFISTTGPVLGVRNLDTSATTSSIEASPGCVSLIFNSAIPYYTKSTSPAEDSPIYGISENCPAAGPGTVEELSHTVVASGSGWSSEHSFWAPGSWILTSNDAFVFLRFPAGDVVIGSTTYYAWVQSGGHAENAFGKDSSGFYYYLSATSRESADWLVAVANSLVMPTPQAPTSGTYITAGTITTEEKTTNNLGEFE